MPAVDRALARIGCFELLFMTDVPPTVVIDEIVTMAADISTDDSPAFLNGLLSRIESIKHRISLD
jgi:N utilization substance protein B